MSIEIWSLVLAIISTIVGIVTYMAPPVGIRQKFVHGFYLLSFTVMCVVFAYLLWGKQTEIEVLKIQRDERYRLSVQAAALLESLPPTNSGNCHNTILMTFSFLEKWRMELPGSISSLKAIVDATPEPAAVASSYIKQRECITNAELMMSTIKSLAAGTRTRQ